jgi:hypothetical protein
MPIEYESDEGLVTQVNQMLSLYPELGHLRNNDVRILSCLKVQMDNNGDPVSSKGDAVTINKINAIHRHFLNAHFIIVMDHGFWVDQSISTQSKRAALHRALMKAGVKEVQGEIKTHLRRPNIVEFTETVTRFGPEVLGLQTLLASLQSAATQVAEMSSQGATG